MRQLFWRLNIQQHRNTKYKRNKDKAGDFGTKRVRGPSHDLGIDTDVAGVASASRDAVESPATPKYDLQLYSCNMNIYLTGFPDHQQSSTSLTHPLVPTWVSSYRTFVKLDQILRTSGKSAKIHTVFLKVQTHASCLHL